MLDFLRGPQFNPNLIDPYTGGLKTEYQTKKSSISLPHLRGSNRFLSVALTTAMILPFASFVAPNKAKADGTPVIPQIVNRDGHQLVLGMDNFVRNVLTRVMKVERVEVRNDEHSEPSTGNELQNIVVTGIYPDGTEQTKAHLLVWVAADNHIKDTDGYMTVVTDGNGDPHLRYVGDPLFDFEHEAPPVVVPNPAAPAVVVTPPPALKSSISQTETQPNMLHAIDYSDWNSDNTAKLQGALNVTLGYNVTLTIDDLDSDFKSKLGPERVARYATAIRQMSAYRSAVNKIKKIGVDTQYPNNLGNAFGNGWIALNKDLVEGKRYSSSFTDILIQEILYKEIITNDLNDQMSPLETEPLALYITSLVTRNKIKAGADFQRSSSADQLRTQAIQAIPA